MMKNLLTKLFTLCIGLALLFGCANTNENTDPPENNSTATEQTNEANEEVVIITISKDEGAEVLSEKEVAIEDGTILMDVMKENFDIEENGGFISAIDGVEAKEEDKMFWAISVNDEMAEVGAAEYELTADDDVVFDLQSWE
jgi:hypothetical protein